MALTNSTIEAVEGYLGSIEGSFGKITTSADSFDYVTQNEDFVTFTEGTMFGSDTCEKVKKMVEMTYNDYTTEVNSLLTSTREFLDKQRTLNNQS